MDRRRALALEAVVKSANTAGVPVVMFDSGIEDWQRMGAIDVLRL